MSCRALCLFAALALLAGCGTPAPAEPDASVEGPTDAGSDPGDAGWDAGAEEDTDGGPNIRRITALEVTPKTLGLTVGAVSGVTAVATWNDGATSDVTGTVEWVVQPAGIVEVERLSFGENLARVESLAPGVAQITARSGSVYSDQCTVTVTEAPLPDAGTPPTEYRAVWVTRFHYNTAAHVTRIINDAADAGFNVVFFQIRGNGDAYYQSQLVPWAQKLTGTLGEDPGWDPLQLAIDTAHARGMELHAYWNVFSAWPCSGTACACRPEQGFSDSCTLPPASPSGKPEHALRTHPEWMAVDAQGKNKSGSEYFWFSPGNTDVRAHLSAVADELLTSYAVDGLHLDRIRYAGSGYSHDAASVTAYNALPAATRPSWEDWQREQVNLTVEALYDVVKLRRPQALLSASVWGIYKRLPGCNTSEGYSGYYQDSIAWMKNGQIDALVPMIYWDFNSNGGCTDWGDLVDGFLAGSNGRPIIAGMHALDSSRPQLDRMTARVEYGRTVGAAGHAIFASSYLDAKSSGSPTWPEQWPLFREASGPYQEDAWVPGITWR